MHCLVMHCNCPYLTCTFSNVGDALQLPSNSNSNATNTKASCCSQLLHVAGTRQTFFSYVSVHTNLTLLLTTSTPAANPAALQPYINSCSKPCIATIHKLLHCHTHQPTHSIKSCIHPALPPCMSTHSNASHACQTAVKPAHNPLVLPCPSLSCTQQM